MKAVAAAAAAAVAAAAAADTTPVMAAAVVVQWVREASASQKVKARLRAAGLRLVLAMLTGVAAESSKIDQKAKSKAKSKLW